MTTNKEIHKAIESAKKEFNICYGEYEGQLDCVIGLGIMDFSDLKILIEASQKYSEIDPLLREMINRKNAYDGTTFSNIDEALKMTEELSSKLNYNLSKIAQIMEKNNDTT